MIGKITIKRSGYDPEANPRVIDPTLEPTLTEPAKPMHPRLAEAVLDLVRRRDTDTDCPNEPAPSVETLEACLLEIANQRERLSRESSSLKTQLEEGGKVAGNLATFARHIDCPGGTHPCVCGLRAVLDDLKVFRAGSDSPLPESPPRKPGEPCPRWATCFSNDCTCHPPSVVASPVRTTPGEAEARRVMNEVFGDGYMEHCDEARKNRP